MVLSGSGYQEKRSREEEKYYVPSKDNKIEGKY